MVVDNDTEVGEFADLLKASPWAATQGQDTYARDWWRLKGATTTAVMSSWRFDSPTDLEAVLRLEFPGDVVDTWLTAHPAASTSVTDIFCTSGNATDRSRVNVSPAVRRFRGFACATRQRCHTATVDGCSERRHGRVKRESVARKDHVTPPQQPISFHIRNTPTAPPRDTLLSVDRSATFV